MCDGSPRKQVQPPLLALMGHCHAGLHSVSKLSCSWSIRMCAPHSVPELLLGPAPLRRLCLCSSNLYNLWVWIDMFTIISGLDMFRKQSLYFLLCCHPFSPRKSKARIAHILEAPSIGKTVCSNRGSDKMEAGVGMGGNPLVNEIHETSGWTDPLGSVFLTWKTSGLPLWWSQKECLCHLQPPGHFLGEGSQHFHSVQIGRKQILELKIYFT